MRSGTLEAVLLACTLTFAGVRGQIGQGSTQLYSAGISANGVGRVGDGYYLPPGCSYVVGYYAQCGGNGTQCDPASGVCADAQYPGSCCPTGYTCSRENPQYWQCIPQTPTYASTTLSPLQPFAQCGGPVPANSNYTLNSNGMFANTQCPIGYSCTPQGLGFSSAICTPNPMSAANQQYQSPYLDIGSLLPPGQVLAPGLSHYNFNVPAKGQAPPKPVDLVVNTTLINDFLDQLLNQTAPPPPGPGVAPSPSVPVPPPPPASNFTIPEITFQAPPPISIVANELVTSNGSEVNLHGFNWYGFETGNTMVQGLTPNYADPHNISQTGDFATMVYRQQALGLNSVRLPFRFGDLNLAPLALDRPCSIDTLAEIEGNLTNPTVPYYAINYTNLQFPAQTAPPANGVNTTGICNSYVPNDSTLDRFLYVIQFFIGNGFYVTIDYHAGLGAIESDRQIVSNPTVFEENWLAVLTALQSLPTYEQYIKGRIFFDLLNEPDGFNMTWSYPNINTRGQFANSSTVPAWGNLFTDTAALLVAQEPSLLLLAEGTGQSYQPGTSYGQGFGVNPAIYSSGNPEDPNSGALGLSSALGGLQTLVANTAVQTRTLISPHVYGPQVTGWTVGNTNAATPSLPFTYYNNWAYLSVLGVPPANGGANVTFPILVGEYGNVFNSSLNATTNQTSSPLDNTWIHDFAEFNNNLDQTTALTYPHLDVVNTHWWAWNGDQDQALGLVNADAGNVTASYNGPLYPGYLYIQWVKIDNMTNTLSGNPYYSFPAGVASGGGFGLEPWYLTAPQISG